MTSGARITLKFFKREAFNAMLIVGFKFTMPLSDLGGITKVKKVFPKTGELLIITTFPDTEKEYLNIVGIKTAVIHLEQGIFKKLL